MNELTQINPMSIEYQDAMQLHTQIITSGSVAASALVDMCKGLKKMRDTRQYIHLGYENFEDYVETACKMKERQAYTYISTIERLGEAVLQSNANLGITKLSLLASVSDSQRDEILENHDVDEMSTRELQTLRDELTKAREQISLVEKSRDVLGNQIDALLEDVKNGSGTSKRYEDRIKSLETEKEKHAAEIEKIKKDAYKEAMREAKQKAEEKLAAELKTKEEEARKAGREEGMKQAQHGLEAIERDKAQALARAQELEKKLSVAGNSETVLFQHLFFQHLFTEFQGNYNKMVETVGRIADKDPEVGQRYKAVVRKLVLEILPKTLPEE